MLCVRVDASSNTLRVVTGCRRQCVARTKGVSVLQIQGVMTLESTRGQGEAVKFACNRTHNSRLTGMASTADYRSIADEPRTREVRRVRESRGMPSAPGQRHHAR